MSLFLFADCPTESPEWFRCKADLECVAVPKTCGRFGAVRRTAAGEAEARARCDAQRVKCLDVRQEAPPEVLCHAQKCTLARDLVNEAMRTGSLALFRAGTRKNVEVSLSHVHETPLTLAALNANVAMVKYALERGAKVDAQTTTGYTALMFAAMGAGTAKAQALATLDLLIAAGADRSLKNTSGETAFDLAKDADIRNRLK